MLDAIRDLQPGQVIWDRGERASVPGLHAKALPNGRKVLLLFYRTKVGRQRRPKIGDLGQITLGEARRRARLILDQVAIGKDPQGDWETARAELTVDELFAKVCEVHWDQARYVRSGWGSEAKRIYAQCLRPQFGRLRLSELATPAIKRWHISYGTDHPYASNRALSVLSKLFQVAEELELRPQHSNPCTLVKKLPEQKRGRFASKEELIQILQILERKAEDHPAPVAFICMLLFSGSRPRAIERARWEDLEEFEIDGEQYGILKFHGKTSSESGQEETVVLPPQAMRAIDRLPRVRGGTITGMGMPRKFWDGVREEIGCKDLWIRDLRRTFATTGLSGGVDIGIIGELLNHRTTQTTKIYAKVVQTRKIEAASQIANSLSKLISEK